MTVGTMRFIDRYAGIPLCWFTGLFRRFAADVSSNPPTVLAIKFFGLGSVLLTGPTLRLLKDHFPATRIIFLTFGRNRDIASRFPFVDEALCVETESLFLFLHSFFQVVRRLSQLDINVVVDFEFFSKFSTFIGALARPSIQIGFALPTRWRARNLSHAIPLNKERHVSVAFAALLAPLGVQASNVAPLLLRPRYGRDRFNLRTKLPATLTEIICVNPNAGDTSLDRRWGQSNYAALVRELLKKNDKRIFCFVGSEKEANYVQIIIEEIGDGHDRVRNLAGKTTLNEFVALLDQSRLLITNDSGPMHLAAALGLPTVAIFGPESPQFYGPLGNRTINLSANLPCSPCLNVYNAKVFKCPIDAACMEAISVSQVLNAVEQSLNARRISLAVGSTYR